MKTIKLPFAKATPRQYFDLRLHDMLTYQRPHNTPMELDWADKFLGPYKPILVGKNLDNLAAYVIVVPCADGSASKVLFSAHVDTVHRQQGRQKVLFRAKDNRYYKADGQPLGADDGAGVWMLLELIDAGVPGTYVFHRGEECGGIGSKWLTDAQPQWAQQFDYAIAFDRKATHSIITHQGWGRCCSDAFAEELADRLNTLSGDAFMYSPDDTGVYTDTAEYVDLVGECTNISVGYYNEHTAREELDLAHLFALRDAAIKLDWSTLPVVRKKGEIERKQLPNYWSGTNSNISTGKGIYIAPMDADLFSMDYDELYDLAHFDTDTFLELLFNQVPEFGLTSAIEPDNKPVFKTLAEELDEVRELQESGRMSALM